LCLTQPAVSFHIRSLENQTGSKLLNVKGNKVYLTSLGQSLLQYAEEIGIQAKAAERLLWDCKEKFLRVGVSITFSSIAASVAARFRQISPAVKLSLRTGTASKIINESFDLEHDIAIVPEANYDCRKLKFTRLGTVKLVLVASPTHPICHKKEPKLADLNGHVLLLPEEGSATREMILRKVVDSEASPIMSLDTNDLQCIKKLVEKGEAVCFMEPHNVESEIRQGSLRIVATNSDLVLGINAVLVTREHVSVPRLGEEFLSLLKETLASCDDT
jgi:DNA-binding transcriptional LysR family regulator